MSDTGLQNVFSTWIDKFKSKVMPNAKISRGILNSEGFAFCALAEQLGVDLIVESGVCNGGSTTILGKYFTDIPIVSVDVVLKMEAVIRTSIFHNVTLATGDGNTLLPQMCELFADKKIAVLIDGPKGVNAITLAGKCFSYDNVVMVGIHDMFKALCGELKQDRILFDGLQVKKFVTDDEDFVKEYGHLLNGNDGNPRNKKYYSEEHGGYGPTIGFMLKG